jgi:hypothetical protein
MLQRKNNTIHLVQLDEVLLVDELDDTQVLDFLVLKIYLDECDDHHLDELVSI